MIIDTLPGWLNFQARQQHAKVAIRHKQLGIWHEKTWGELKHILLQFVQVLIEKGFERGDTLYVLSHPRPEALLLSIAAQWLGGVAAPLDNADTDETLLVLLEALNPKFVFAESQVQVDQVLGLSNSPKLVIYADGRGLSGYDHSGHAGSTLYRFSDFDYLVPVDYLNFVSIAAPEEVAFKFYRIDSQGELEFQTLSHAEMLTQGRHIIQQEELTSDEEALAARAFAASGHVRYLLAPWLIAGFKLNFPENIHTRDIDRRELGPTFVLGTADTYQRLETMVKARLPLPNTAHRKLLDWALSHTKTTSLWHKILAYLLVIRPLRDVIGFSRTRVPLLVGESLPADTTAFFHAIGIQVKHWPDKFEWQSSEIKVNSAGIYKEVSVPKNHYGPAPTLSLNKHKGVAA